MKRINDDDNFEMIAGKLCLKDGHKFRVPVAMRDSAPKLHLHDGHGRPAGRRPGWVIAADGNPNAAELQQAHDAHAQYLENAWRGDAEGGKEGDQCTCKGGEFVDYFGSPGHLQMRGGKLVCVPDELSKADAASNPTEGDDDEDDPPPRRRRSTKYNSKGDLVSTTVEEDSVCRMQDQHQTRMQPIYDQLDAELRGKFRS